MSRTTLYQQSYRRLRIISGQSPRVIMPHSREMFTMKLLAAQEMGVMRRKLSAKRDLSRK